MQYEKKDNEVRLFKNKYKNTDNHPDMTGKGKVNGKDIKASAWANTDKNGNKWLKISIQDDVEDVGGLPQ
jgi:uncharacterized protein (DUF736 family)